VEDLDEDLNYFTIQPPALKTAKNFDELQGQKKDNRLFTDRPKKHAQDTPRKLQKMLRKLEASVAKNSVVGTPSKHARKNRMEDKVWNI
jgi:hypothetical protein